MKRLLCALLALVLALVCVPAMADVARVTEKPKEFTVWAAYNPTYQTEWESIKAWKYFEEATGVHINWVLFSNDEMSEKLNTLIGSADFEHFPDAFYRCWISDSMLKRFGPDGMFLDLKELVQENAPNLCKALDEMDAWSNVLDPETGAMYSVPELNSALSARMHPKMFFNKKMLEAVGGKVPTTTDELYELLVKVRDADANGNGDANDEIGVTSNGLSNVLRAFTGAFGLNNRGREDLSVDADPSDPDQDSLRLHLRQLPPVSRLCRQALSGRPDRPGTVRTEHGQDGGQGKSGHDLLPVLHQLSGRQRQCG